ncbi:MAG: LPS-assembly protein LptD [Candidatus Amulumruptor caecigallinarius]|nr:LPS-assembly protein LptD [Candidatus Amulumruptor caecigallinarius]
MRRFILYIFIIAFIGAAYSRQSDEKTASGGGPGTSDTVISTEPLATLTSDSLPPGSLTEGVVETEINDTVILHSDSILNDSITKKRLLTRIDRSQVDLEGPVTFSAGDSLVLDGLSNAYLFGNGTVEYQDFKLNSEEIRMELDSSTVYALGLPDSTGTLQGTPIFKDKSGEYEAETMKYNFKTERGYITGVITEQDEGYLKGGVAKRNSDGSFFVEDGKYTTCDDHEHPHFYFQLTKAKVRPDKDVVTGPGYMVLADVPLPLALPFGYFPFSKKYSSGVIFPTFGDDYNLGFYLRDGGYYFAINDNVDLALTGEIYTKGSWGVKGHTNYVKRYRYRGTFDISFLSTVYGDKGAPDYSRMKNFQVIWSHQQDAKANPNLNFSASVNFATSGYSRNDLNSYYNSSFTENTKSSTVNMTYRIPGSKWSFSATANITQRSQDSTLQVSFPNLTWSMSQTAPFKRKRSVGGERWYEKIKMSYQGQLQNSLTSKQDEFFKKSLVKDWKNGMSHSLPISATFSIFKYINMSPSIRMNDRMYTSKVRRQWDPQASREIQDTTYGFYNLFDFNVSLSFDTKVYGFWKPMKFLGDKVQMIRHVLTPSVSVSWAPDFGTAGWGYYGYYTYLDQNGEERRQDYSYFQHGGMGIPSRGKNGIVSLSLANNLEMKVKSDADSTGVKKISLIENLSLTQSYNFAADSLRFSPLQMNVMLRLVKNFNLNLNTTWDPYVYRLNEYGNPVQVNRLRIQEKMWPWRLSSAGTSFSYTFNNDTFRKKKDTPDTRKQDEEDPGAEEAESFADLATRRRERRKEVNTTESQNADGYAKWDFPWSLSVNYSVNYGYGEFDYDKMQWKGKWTQNLSFNGNLRPTKNWNFSFSASYDSQMHKIAYMNCSISRDLHCFTMSASFVPVGPYKSYNFHIAVKSSLLKDLKYDQRSQSNNGVQWY